MEKLKKMKIQKQNEKKELERSNKSSNQTLIFLSNYYKNIKRKMNDIGNNN